MSVIIGIIRNNMGMVASDGRISSFGELNVRRSVIIRDNFDKTFSIADGKVIGCYCGLVQINNRPVGEHINEIIANDVLGNRNFNEIITNLRTELSLRLQRVNDTEAIVNNRGATIVLIPSPGIGEVKLYTIKFKAVNGIIESELDIYPATPKGTNTPYMVVWGDDLAMQHVSNEFTNSTTPLKDAEVRSMLYHLIRNVGIKNAGLHPLGDHQSCGGKVYVKEFDNKVSIIKSNPKRRK